MINVKEYELHLIENEIAPNTIKNYMNTLESLNQYMLINDIDLMTKEALIYFKRYLREKEYKPGKTYTTSTINQKIICLNVYFNWKYPEGSSSLKLKLEKEQTKAHRDSITRSDFKRLLRYSDGEIYFFILVIANTGLRITEVCNLKKEDLEKVMIEINNKGKDRIIAIPAFLRKSLLKWDYVRELNNNTIIFSKTQPWYRRELKKVAGKARVNKAKVYPHSIRHYFAKEFIANGGDSTDLQQMLGHADIKTTTIYTKKNKEELADLFKKNKNK